MHTFVINLDRSTDRLAFMRGQLDKLGMSFERIAAINGLNVPADLAPYFAHIGSGKAPIIDNGAVGCYASHLRVYQQIAAQDIPRALILEDDARLSDDFPTTLGTLLQALPEGWDFVHLGHPHRRAVKALVQLPFGQLVRYSQVPSGTYGYLITLEGARKLLNPDIPRCWAIDTDTRCPWLFGLDVYGVVPNPIHSGGFATTIPSSTKRWRRGLPRPTPLSWHNFPITTPASALWNMRQLGFACWVRCLIVNAYTRFAA